MKAKQHISSHSFSNKDETSFNVVYGQFDNRQQQLKKLLEQLAIIHEKARVSPLPSKSAQKIRQVLDAVYVMIKLVNTQNSRLLRDKFIELEKAIKTIEGNDSNHILRHWEERSLLSFENKLERITQKLEEISCNLSSFDPGILRSIEKRISLMQDNKSKKPMFSKIQRLCGINRKRPALKENEHL